MKVTHVCLKLQAVSLDRADVVLWDRIAKHALELKNMPLARLKNIIIFPFKTFKLRY
jgi:hypothetical protein